MQGARWRGARCGPLAYWTYMSLSAMRQMGLRDRYQRHLPYSVITFPASCMRERISYIFDTSPTSSLSVMP